MEPRCKPPIDSPWDMVDRQLIQQWHCRLNDNSRQPLILWTASRPSPTRDMARDGTRFTADRGWDIASNSTIYRTCPHSLWRSYLRAWQFNSVKSSRPPWWCLATDSTTSGCCSTLVIWVWRLSGMFAFKLQWSHNLQCELNSRLLSSVFDHTLPQIRPSSCHCSLSNRILLEAL